MSRARQRLAAMGDQLRDGEWQSVRTDLAGWAWSHRLAVGLKRQFDIAHEQPRATTVSLTVRPLDKHLADKVFDVKGLDERDRSLLERRKAIWDAKIAGGFVALGDDGSPAYLQWFIPYSEAAKVASYWGPLFPKLRPETLLVEGAWVPPKYRGKKVMGDAMYLLTETARAIAPSTVTGALTYVETNNKGALLGVRSAGYEVVEKRTERWRLGRRLVSFEPASAASFSVFQGTAAVKR